MTINRLVHLRWCGKCMQIVIRLGNLKILEKTFRIAPLNTFKCLRKICCNKFHFIPHVPIDYTVPKW